MRMKFAQRSIVVLQLGVGFETSAGRRVGVIY